MTSSAGNFPERLTALVEATGFCFAPIDCHSPIGLVSPSHAGVAARYSHQVVAFAGVGPGAIAESHEQASRYKTALVQMAGPNDLHVAVHPEPTTALRATTANLDTAYTIPALPVSTLSQLFIHAPEGDDQNVGDNASPGSGDVDGSGSDEALGSSGVSHSEDDDRLQPNGYSEPSQSESGSGGSASSADGSKSSNSSSDTGSEGSHMSQDEGDDSANPDPDDDGSAPSRSPTGANDATGGQDGSDRMPGDQDHKHEHDRSDGDGPEAKRPRLRGAGQEGQGVGVDDPRCQRCATYGQLCVHSTIGHDKLLPGPCAGCVSNKVDCSFVDTVPAPPDVSGLATGQSRQHIFLGFNDPVTRTVFLEFLEDIVDMGVSTAGVKAETVELFQRLSDEAISRVPRLYIDNTGQVVLVES